MHKDLQVLGLERRWIWTNFEIYRDCNDKFFSYICLIFLSSMFLFVDNFMFEEKKVPAVTTANALHGVFNFFFLLKSIFVIKLKLHSKHSDKPNFLEKFLSWSGYILYWLLVAIIFRLTCRKQKPIQSKIL